MREDSRKHYNKAKRDKGDVGMANYRCSFNEYKPRLKVHLLSKSSCCHRNHKETGTIKKPDGSKTESNTDIPSLPDRDTLPNLNDKPAR